MKRFSCFILIVLLTLALFSCKSDVIQEEPPAPPALEEQEIVELTPEPEPEVEEVKTVRFIGCGDNITYGTKDARSKAYEGGRELNFKPQYAEVADMIESADIAFINQECVMAEEYSLSWYPRFNVPRELGLDLVELGYDVINIATNHMLDKNADGLQSTIDFWKSLDVLMIGGYENEEDFDNIRIIEKNGIKFAFLAYTEFTNGLVKDPSSPIVIPYINDEDIIRQTALARECADFVFVSVHWGNEGAFTPSSEQRRVAQLMADCGVDAIIGHHPHVLQPIEWLEGTEGNRTLCVFSLGNFVAEQDRDYNMVGGIIDLEITQTGERHPEITNVLFHPTVFHFSNNFYTNVVYFMEDYTPELADEHGVRRYYGHSLSYTGLLDYAETTISEEFLTQRVTDVFKNY